MIADRVRLARRKAGYSLRDLSAAMDEKVTPQAIGKYERGESTPSSGVLLALAKALGVSLAYLLDTQGIALSGVEFRTKANTSARDRANVETEVLEWIERYLQIERVLDLDSARWHCPVARPRKLSDPGDAEKLAEDVREKWKLGLDPIPDMTELLEEKGLKVLTVPLPERVSGFTCLVKRPDEQAELPVIVVNSNFPLERRRLTLAHELAHRLIDTDSLSDRHEEKAATVFAGAFLVPRQHLQREAGKHRNALGYKELIELKRLYRVSGSALLMRLQQAGVISEAILIYAFQSIARGWRTREPEELEAPKERGQRERACRFERLCYRALAEGFISLAKAAELLRLPVPEVEAGLKGPPSGAAGRNQ
ncbi:MAG: helix-turn-helix domain-containing protein [Betaproteobacteria bacterium]|nr:helix-turn-helix domain-containing protein [Betaproteobacteria bacterium]